jgi:hypothetical protein
MKIPPDANDPAKMQEFTQRLNELEVTLRQADTALMGANTLRAKVTRAATRLYMALVRKVLEWLATQKPAG